jgi:hypothetical protein
MASTYSDRLKLELQGTGENAGTWGDKTNNNLDVLDAFAAGYLSKNIGGSADVTLTTANASATAESSNKVIDLNGTLTGSITVFIPAKENNYIIYNNTSGSFSLTVAATGHGANGVAITQGAYDVIYCDGSPNFNVSRILSNFGAISTGDLTVTGNVNASINTNITGNASITGNAAITGNVNVTSNVNITDSLNADDIVVTNTSTLSGTTTVDGVFTVNNTAVFNEGSGDFDFRIESNNNLNMFFVDAGNDKIGIGQSSPTASFTVANNAIAEQGTLSDGATITPDFAQKNNFTVTLAGNRTLAAPINPQVGQCGYIRILQDGTGGRTLTFNAVYKFINGNDLDMSSAAANTIFRLDYVVMSATEIHVNGTGPYS